MTANNLDDSGTVWSNKSRLVLSQQFPFNADHVLLWNTFRDCDDQADLGVNCFQDCCGCCRWWHIDNCCLTLSSCLGLHQLSAYGNCWWSGFMVSALASINEVNLCRARLVLRWATVSGFNSRCRTLISICNRPATQGQLSLPSLRGR